MIKGRQIGSRSRDLRKLELSHELDYYYDAGLITTKAAPLLLYLPHAVQNVMKRLYYNIEGQRKPPPFLFKYFSYKMENFSKKNKTIRFFFLNPFKYFPILFR